MLNNSTVGKSLSHHGPPSRLRPSRQRKDHCGTKVRVYAHGLARENFPVSTESFGKKSTNKRGTLHSYLTIELKGSIPIELRSLIGNRIFGCDDCLAVCLWNRFAQTERLMRNHARSDLEAPDLLELLGLDDAGFKARFTGTPLWRTKRRGLLRNVCVALGKVGTASALPG